MVCILARINIVKQSVLTVVEKNEQNRLLKPPLQRERGGAARGSMFVLVKLVSTKCLQKIWIPDSFRIIISFRC